MTEKPRESEGNYVLKVFFFSLPEWIGLRI